MRATTWAVGILIAGGFGGLAALPRAAANPPCTTFAPSYPVLPAYSAPYVAPVYHPPYKEVVIKEYAVPFAYFAFVAQPTTPPPVVVAAPAPPPPPPPSPLPVPSPCQAGCPVAPAAPPPAVVPSGGAGVAPGSEDRLARVEALLVKLAERQLAVPADAAPVAREAPVATPPAPAYDANAALVLNDLRACAQCHTGPDSRGGVELFNAQGQWAPEVSQAEIYRAVKSGRMPRGPVKWSPEQIERLRLWAGAAGGGTAGAAR
jgi:hypothetical protein